ncbi:c-type cytochrome [Undibacterium sp.]|uniref:c-type cytochrome n=1 Tax=Undibacterium sp. TaxID=1914977 RepID=UPI0025ECD23B|nr:c-type cytochrome [Undibacterium sp.]
MKTSHQRYLLIATGVFLAAVGSVIFLFTHTPLSEAHASPAGSEKVAAPVTAASNTLSTTASSAMTASSFPIQMPDDSSLPKAEMGEAVQLGRNLVLNTQKFAKAYVGNGLNCSSCHLNGGTVAGAAPFVGLWGVFPEYRSRTAAMGSLQARINDCFQRSMNGKALPHDSVEMNAMLSYIWWLSKGVPTGMSVNGRGFKPVKSDQAPDLAHGLKVYAEKCASCHGDKGEGQQLPDGGYLFPALWGDRSFNIGAGMARLNNAAAFVKANMPLGQGGTLSDQEAIDVAAFFTTQKRPDYAEKSKDWSKGGKPKDARY